MRWTNWMLAFAMVVAMAGFLAAAEVNHSLGNPSLGNHSCTSCEQQGTYDKSACMTPGCCKNPPSPCDNIWDGYCEEKARKQAFWSKIGTGAYCGCKRPARVTTYAASTPCPPVEEGPAVEEGVPEEAPDSVESAQFDGPEVDGQEVDCPETPNPLRVLDPTARNDDPLAPMPSDPTPDAEVSMHTERPIPLPPIDRTS